MATAAIYGLLASSSFVVGVALGLATKPPRRLLAVVITFGAGVLVSALTFDLMAEAFEKGTGPMPSVASWSARSSTCSPTPAWSASPPAPPNAPAATPRT
jgi:zinc transporter ZupT